MCFMEYIVWSNCISIPSHCQSEARNMQKKKKESDGEHRKNTRREELERSRRLHLPEALLEGAGTLTMSAPGTVIVIVPDNVHLRPKPVHAALHLDTSLSSAACGFEKSPRFVGHHESHLEKSITLEADTQDIKPTTERHY